MLSIRLSNLTIIAMNSNMLNTIDFKRIVDILSQKQRRSELMVCDLLCSVANTLSLLLLIKLMMNSELHELSGQMTTYNIVDLYHKMLQ